MIDVSFLSKFQPLKREAACLACCARSIAWEADKSNAFRESHFWGGSWPETMRSCFALFPRHAACGVLRESLLRPSLTETLGKLFSLDEKQHRVGWRWSSDRFHFADTIRTQWIEPDTVLPGCQVLCQPG